MKGETKRMLKKILMGGGVFLIVLVLGVGIGFAQGGRGNGRGRGTGGQGRAQQGHGMLQRDASETGNISQYGQYGSGGQGQGNMNSNQGMNVGLGTNFYSQLPPATEGKLSAEVIDAMTDGWLDEYHAYMTYQTVIDQFGAVSPFVNIQRSEAQHMAAWEFIFDRYSLELPTDIEPIATIQFSSLSEACQIAADAEIANFSLYNDMLETLQDYPDMIQVVTVLRNASEVNHLPAFQNCAQ